MLFMFLADGFEDTEAIATLDVIRRAEIDIKTVSVLNNPAVSTHGVKIFADADDIDLKECDGIILPGGMPGTINLKNSDMVKKAIDYCVKNNLLIASICAAPSIVGSMGLLENKNATCFPGFEKYLLGANILDIPVVCDGNFITSKGAGASFLFGARIVDYIKNSKTDGDNVLSQMQYNFKNE